MIGEGREHRDLLRAHLAEHALNADQVFFLNFTSGTEGTPKGFLHTHNSFLPTLKRFAEMGAGVHRIAGRLRGLNVARGDRVVLRTA